MLRVLDDAMAGSGTLPSERRAYSSIGNLTPDLREVMTDLPVDGIRSRG